MSNLKTIWADYKTREKSEPRSKLMELETKIHELEDKQGYDHYNFDKRWEKREKDEGLAEFTEAKAETILTDTYIKIVEEETMKTIATRKIIAEIAVKEDPTAFERNPAGVGQLVNLTMENIKRRLEDGDKKD
tara:strand:+ start:626 stop:1024 length:399 start_codon:yes stop_codon:yes gene_type:complete